MSVILKFMVEGTSPEHCELLAAAELERSGNNREWKMDVVVEATMYQIPSGEPIMWRGNVTAYEKPA